MTEPFAMPRIVRAQDLADDDLVSLYRVPESGRWIRANFVASVDGAIATDGTSSGLTNPLDQRVLKLLRELADVVLVGASTIRAEDYIGIRVSEAGRTRRAADGMAPVPPIAVVSGRADIDPESRLLTNTLVPPIIFTTTDAASAAKRNLRSAGATVIELGSGSIETGAIVAELTTLGLQKVVCEGGPTLAGQLAADHVLDELCLTTAPTVMGGPAGRVTHSRLAALPVQCRHIIFDTDGAQLARWISNKPTRR
ncbi:pyrimidine reductase family protein [Nocardia cyriacigeorgica]|uniref:pyrimidine reductase family protein n=1 Tax=Nocardia cyriacigeorgica TaxID=135487 RepID=UPI00245655B6|nr:pyrimidine reductase family protein [Nocardia cyriacigeorgica]